MSKAITPLSMACHNNNHTWCTRFACICDCHLQGSLFDEMPHARDTDPDTSHEAAAALGGASKMRQRLLDVFEVGDWTSEEAAKLAGYTAEDGAWKRISDLQRAGLIADTGERRAGSSGRQQRVMRKVT